MSEEGETATVEETAPRRSLGRRIAKWSAIAVGSVVVLIAALLLFLNTGPGKRLIADQIAELEFENGLQIDVGRIGGSIYGEMVLYDVSLSDPKGTFLTSPEVRVDWSPFALINSHVDIESATSKLITFERLPEFNEVPPNDDPFLPPYDIDIAVLKVDRFVVEKAVSGERQVGAIEGEVRLADQRAKLQLNAALSGGDRIEGLIDAVPDDGKLALDLDLEAPGNGVLAAMAGLSQPFSATLKGSGDWADWSGQFDADLDEVEFARLAVTAEDGTFSFRGPTQVARLFEGSTAALLGPVLDLDVSAALDGSRVTLTGGANSDALRINTNGLVDLSESQFEDFKLGLAFLDPSALAGNVSGSGARALLTLNGELSSPQADYVVTADRLAFNDTAIENLRATGAARIDPEQIIIPVNATVGRLTGFDTLAGGSITNVRLTGDLAIANQRILSDNIRITNDRIDAEVILVADLNTGLYTGAVDGRIDNYRVETVGIFNVETDLDLETRGSGFAISGQVRARSTAFDSEGVRDFLGGNLIASANISYGTDGVTRVSNITMRAPLLRVTRGSGTYSANGQLNFTAAGVSTEYGPVGLQLAGTFSNPDATVTLDNPGYGINLANVTARITAARGGYNIAATGSTDYGPLNANVIARTGRVLTLDVTSGDLDGIGFSGQLVQTPTGPFAGRLNADGKGVVGVVRLDAEGEYQEALINLRAQNTALSGPAKLFIGSAIVDARVILYDQPYVVGDIEVAQTSSGPVMLSAARAKINYQDGSGTARILAEGTSGVPFRVSANAQLEPEVWRAAINGRVRGIEFSTDSPARILPKTDEYELLPTRISFGRGSARVAGSYGEGLKIQSRLDEIDLAIVEAFYPGLGVGGRATGSLDFEQPDFNTFPRADARLRVADFNRTTAVSVSEPVNMNFVGKLLPSGGQARAVMRQRGSVIGRVNATLSPLPPEEGDWVTRMLNAPLGGGIRYNGPASTLFSFAAQPDQRMAGPIAVAADFSGRVDDPELEGVVRGTSLTYENLTYGTRLSEMILSARFEGTGLVIEQMTANAGDGTVSATGSISLAEASGYPMDIEMTLNDARLARSETLSATASGTFQLTKVAGEDALLSGDLVLPETRYALSQSAAEELPQLSGVRFKPPRGPQRITGDEPADTQVGLFGQVRLNIGLEADERLFVTGMGIDSEWSADLNLTGTSADPRLGGTVTLERGTLDFAGRSFDLENGLLSFTGGPTINPTIAMTARENIEEVTVEVGVTGRAYDPQIEFTSNPGLPEDEIIARILFGSSIGNLSTIQVVQLAASLSSLSGTGGGLNPLATLRSATGLDRLRILGEDETIGRGTALAVGQYITDDIYVEFITDARGFTATQVEVAITPFLSILSQAGGSGATNVNVRYRKNY